jgi:hypothetical protein
MRGEVKNATEPECIWSFRGQRQLISRYVERRNVCTDRRLDLKKSFPSRYIERQNVIAGPVAEFLGYPFYLPSEIWPIQSLQLLAFEMKNQLLALATKFTISKISLDRIKFADQPFDLRASGCNW